MNSNITIKHSITEINQKDWSDFVKQHPKGNIFQSPELYEVYDKIDKCEPCIFIAYDDSLRIIGCLMSVIFKEYNGVLGKFTERSIVMGGPLVENDNLNIVQSLLQAYNTIIQKKAIYSQFRNLFDMTNVLSTMQNDGFKFEEHLDIFIDLDQTPEVIRSRVSKNKRGNISKSTNKGTIFKEITSYEEYQIAIDLVNGTYKRIGLPSLPRESFNMFYQLLYPKGILKTFAASYNNQLIGVRMELCYKDCVYDWYAGADDNYRNHYPNDFVPYHILMWGQNNGYKYFDFGGAGKPNVPYGVREHKLKFGGTLVNYGRFEKIHKPFLMLLGKFGFFLYKFVKKRGKKNDTKN